MLALALGQSGDVERAATMAEDATAAFEATLATGASQRAASFAQWGRRTPATSLRSPRWPRSPAVTRMRSDTTRFVPRCCRSVGGGGTRGRRRSRGCIHGARSSSARRSGFGDHAAFALAGLGAIAVANSDLRKAEELQRQALATAEAAQAPWVAAQARVQLARIAAASGNTDEPIACTAKFSSGRRCNGRTRRARASSSRLPATPPPQQSAGSVPRFPSPAPTSAHLELAEAPTRLAERWHRR